MEMIIFQKGDRTVSGPFVRLTCLRVLNRGDASNLPDAATLGLFDVPGLYKSILDQLAILDPFG